MERNPLIIRVEHGYQRYSVDLRIMSFLMTYLATVRSFYVNSERLVRMQCASINKNV